MADRIQRRTSLALLAGAGFAMPAVFGSRAARAADYPTRPIRVLVPFSAGGAVDIVARTVMQQVGPQLGVSVIVENRPGASGNIAPALVSQAAPDGYTVLIGANGLATNAALFDNLPFDAQTSLEPVVLVGYSPLILVVPANAPAKTVKDLVEQARAAPGSLTYGSAGNGTSGHLAAEVFKRATGIDALHVPYRGGAQAMVDMLGGRIAFMFLDPVQVMSQIRGGQFRALAVSAPGRLNLLPDVPTVTEAGFPGVEATVWWGFLVPAHTPAEIVMRLNTEINKALHDDKVRDKLLAMGVVIQGGSPEQFAAFLKSETARWAALIKAENIKAD